MASTFNLDHIEWRKGKYNLPEAWLKIKVPGVTSVINETVPDPEMEEWVRKVGQAKVDEILTNAGYRGTAMHLFIENFLNTFAKNKDASEALTATQTLTPPQLLIENIPQYKIDEGRNLFYKFYYSSFANSYENLIATELGIYSASLFYRGKLDVFYKDRVFGVCVTDFKTSTAYIKKGSMKEHKYFLQLGGYVNAVEEMYKEKNLQIKKSSILCVNTKSDELQEIVLAGKELEKYKTEFKTLVKEFHIINNQKYLISA